MPFWGPELRPSPTAGDERADLKSMKKISCIVLPTYNEAQNLERLLPQIFQQAKKIPAYDLHVLVVDDNSADGTAKVVREHMFEYPRLHLLSGEKKGLGDAYKRGMTHAIAELKADLILQMDADLQHDPNLLPRFITLCDEGFDLVIGSRFCAAGATPGLPFHRRLISLVGTQLVRLFGGLPPLHDCTSGYRCIRTKSLLKCDLKGLSSRGYSFQSSLLFELIRNGARVIEVPIVFAQRFTGRSKLSFHDQVEFLANLAKLRLRRSARSGNAPSYFLARK
jgi:dolichol-phosphate mannosyltransferase